MSAKHELLFESDGRDLFVNYNGVKIAKRGGKGTPQAKTWIPLEPGYTVRDIDGGKQVEVEHFGVLVH